MALCIGAENITAITARFLEDGAPLPSAEELIGQILEKLEKSVAEARKGSSLSALRRARGHIAFFKKITADPPQGYRLAPVVARRISPEQSGKIINQFTNRVLPRFYRHIAINFPDDLRRAGICEHGIARMRQGLCPATKDDRIYAFNVDHIIERALSGPLGCERGVDSEYEDAKKDENGYEGPEGGNYLANYFGNLAFMLIETHRQKNALNALQRTDLLRPGQTGIFLMLVPDRDAVNGSPVCVPPAAEPAPVFDPPAAFYISEAQALCARADKILKSPGMDRAALEETVCALGSKLRRAAEMAAAPGAASDRKSLRQMFNGRAMRNLRALAANENFPGGQQAEKAFEIVENLVQPRTGKKGMKKR